MDISQAILIILLSFQNGLLARTKGLQPLWYGFLTALLFIVCEFFGFMFMVLVIFRNIIDFSRVNTDIQYKQKAVADI